MIFIVRVKYFDLIFPHLQLAPSGLIIQKEIQHQCPYSKLDI